MTNTTDTPAEPDLQARVEGRRSELIARLVALRADKREVMTDIRDKLKAKLSELSHIIKEGVAIDGWARVGDVAKHRLDHWLAESAHQLAANAVGVGS